MPSKLNITGISHLRLFAGEAQWQETIHFYQNILGFRLKMRSDEAGIAIFEFNRGPSMSIERVRRSNQKHATLVGRFSGISLGGTCGRCICGSSAGYSLHDAA